MNAAHTHRNYGTEILIDINRTKCLKKIIRQLNVFPLLYHQIDFNIKQNVKFIDTKYLNIIRLIEFVCFFFLKKKNHEKN